jgi:stringent starvation protein B
MSPFMGESAGLPPKKDVMLALLEGPSVYVHLDPRREGVVVPKWFTNQPQLVLQVGLNMAVRIPDLDVSEDGISCTLSFNRSPFWCHLPWSAVYGLVGEDSRGMIWPDDVPTEFSGPPRQRPRLEAVVDAPPSEPAPVGKKTRGRGGRKKADKPLDADATTAVAEPAERPALAPAPALAPQPAPALASAPTTADDSATPRGRSAASKQAPAKPAASPASGSKPKRELPPYLRVVK